MERRERYDPEDIENLLSERAFDELLDEERAFVLRHVSGPEEYARMRALLQHVRPNERTVPPITPDPRVKANVLAAFRAEQQPQWRVWLNSVAIWLAPREGSGFMRPALAFASLALLIAVGVLSVQFLQHPQQDQHLAEVREETNEQEKDIKKESGTTSLDTKDQATGQAEALNEVLSNGDDTKALSDSEMRLQQNEVAIGSTDETQGANRMMDTSQEPELFPALPQSTSPAAMDIQFSEDLRLDDSHVVTAEEFAQNQSLANVSGVSKSITQAEKRAKESAFVQGRSTSMAEEADLLSLIGKGW